MPQLAAAAWAAFSAAAASTAASVTATLTAAGMAAGTAATIGGIVGTVATAARVIGGVMQVASALGIGQKQPQLPSTWSRTQMTIEAAPGLRVAVGETALGGILRANFQTGRKKEIFSEVVALSSAGPIGALHGLIIERQLYTIGTGSGLASGAVSYAPNDMWCYYRLGAWDQASLTPWPGHGTISQPPGWGANHRGAGVAHMFVVCRENPEAFPKGKPRPLARVSGHTGIIDPRTGTTASAAARDLAACWEYTWRLGLTAPNGVRLGGHFKTLSQIDTAAYAAWANRCEELDLRVSGQIDLETDDVEAVSRALMQAGCASYCLKGGKDSVIFQSVKTSVGTLTGADLAGPIEIITSPEIRDRPNGIIPSFASAAHGFEIVPGSMVTATEYQTEDGGLRQASLTLPFVSDVVNPNQAGIVAAYQLVQSRERLYIKGAFHPRVLAFAPGDAVTVNMSALGLSNVKCIVEGRDFGASGAITLALRSETDAKHTWAVDQTSTPPDTTVPQLSDGLPPQPESGQWTATAAQITAGGTNLPIIRVTGTASDYPQGSAVVIRYRLAAAGSPWLGAVELGIDGTAAELSVVTPGTAYVVGVAYRNGYGREGAVRELTSVTTGGFVAGATASPGGGGNAIADPDFQRLTDTTLWATLAPSGTTHTRVVGPDGLSAYLVQVPGTPAAGQFAGIYGVDRNRLAVEPGERVQVSAQVGGIGMVRAYVQAFWWNAAGALFSSSGAVGSSLPSGGGALASYQEVGTILTVPDGAASVSWNVYAETAGGVVAPYLYTVQPVMMKVPGSQEVLSPFSPGFRGQPGADRTGENIAAAVSGQGPLATSSLTEARVRGRFLGEFSNEGAAITAGLQDGDTWRNTSDGKLYGRTAGTSTSVAEPPGTATAKRGRATGSSIVDTGTYATLATVTVDGPAGLADFVGSALGTITPTGSSTSFQLRITRAGTALVEPAAFAGIDGSGTVTSDWIDAMQEIVAAVPSVSAGSAAYALQARRTAGTGSVSIDATIDVTVIAS